MVAFSEISSLKFIDGTKVREEKRVVYEYSNEEKTILPTIDGLRRGAAKPSSEEELSNQVRLRSRHRYLSSRQNKQFIPNVSYGPFVSDSMVERAEVTAFDLRARF